MPGRSPGTTPPGGFVPPRKVEHDTLPPMTETQTEKLATPDAMIYRLFERDGTVWQLGKKWPAPAPAKGESEIDAAKGAVDCTIACIIRFDDEEGDDGEKVDIEPYYQIIGLPIEGGKFAKRGMGVTTDIQLEDVFRTEGLQSAAVLAAYAAEMTGTAAPEPAGG